MRKLAAHLRADREIRGRFSVAKDGCFGAACDLYEIEETELLWVQPAPGTP